MMKPLDQTTARHTILMVAGVYILLLGVVELSKNLGGIDPLTAGELLQKVTTLASLIVGSIIGFYIASRPRQS